MVVSIRRFYSNLIVKPTFSTVFFKKGSALVWGLLSINAKISYYFMQLLMFNMQLLMPWANIYHTIFQNRHSQVISLRGHSKNKIPTFFSKNETVIASVTQWSEAICPVSIDFSSLFLYKFKVYVNLKDKLSAGTWQIASLAPLVRNDSFVFR